MKTLISSCLLIGAFSAQAGLMEWLGVKSKEKVTPDYISKFSEYKWELKSGDTKRCSSFFGIETVYKDGNTEYRFGKADKNGSVNGTLGNLMPLTLDTEGKIKDKHTKTPVQGDLVLEANIDTKMKDGVASVTYKAESHFGEELAKIVGQNATDISFKVMMDPLKEEIVYVNTAGNLAADISGADGECTYRKSSGQAVHKVVDHERSHEVYKEETSRPVEASRSAGSIQE